VEVRARLLAASGDLVRASDLLASQADKPEVPLAPLARLLEEIGAGVSAEPLYKRLVQASTRPEAVLLLASYYGRQNRLANALQLCDQAWAAGELDSVCAAYVDVLYAAAEPRTEQIAHAAGRLEEALRRKPESSSLLSMMAALQNLKRDYASAVSFYRRALALGRKDALDANNLAFLLSASEGKHEEALAELAQAKNSFGPVPTLLDTEAQVHIAQGKPGKARALLNEVITRSPTGPSYFHLAQASLAERDRDDARAAWRQAKKLNLKPGDLHPLERDNYRKLEGELGRE